MSIVVAVFLAAALGTSIVTAQQAPTPAVPAQPAPSPMGNAPELFSSTCAPCHGTDLSGGRGPSLFAERLLSETTDAALLHTIREGIADGGMPAFKGQLSDADIGRLIAYLRIRGGQLKGQVSFLPDPNGQIIKSEKQTFKIEVVAANLDTPWGEVFLPDGRMLVVSMEDRRLLRMEPDGSVVLHADLGAVATGHCNDMVVDKLGRAYVGNFGFPYPDGEQKPARLARADPDGTVVEAADDLMFPNGAVITPDGKTLVVGETFANRMTAFDIAPDGGLSNRRLWASLASNEYPDGCCLDAEGAIWVASPFTNEVIRVREGGEVAERIAATQGVFACMLGGADRRTLYALTASSADPNARFEDRTGRIEAVEVEVPGVGLP